jgi:hypothetical protein
MRPTASTYKDWGNLLGQKKMGATPSVAELSGVVLPTPVAPLCASKEELSHLGLPVESLLVESQGVASR